MDEPNVYDSTSDNGRHIFNEPSKDTDEPMEENDDDDDDDDDAETTRRMDRRRRRAGRRSACPCGSRTRRRRRVRRVRRVGRVRRRRIISQNPFIIFYLEMYFKDPGKRVTEVAREAGKIWSGMSEEDRQKYVSLAEKERIRRCRIMRRRGRR